MLNKKSQEKIGTLLKLAETLKIEVTAKQVISKEGVIENVVYFVDKEQYPAEETPVTETTPVINA